MADQINTVLDPMTRRRFLLSAAALTGSAASGMPALADTPETWTFVHITDIHIQPELGAARGTQKAFDTIRALPAKPDLALIGGDLVMDANKVPHERADFIYDLWRTEAAHLDLPMYYTVGNHDAYALGEPTQAQQSDPDYGKGMWKRRIGLDRTYTYFDHRGWRFIVLDSIGFTPDGSFEGILADDQIAWLDDLLRRTPKTQPVVVLTHMPFITAFAQFTSATTTPLVPQLAVKNGKTFTDMIQGYNVKAVFQGHTHVVEECIYLGTHYITGGAICGNWWKGPRLGVHPEGFVVATVSGDDLTWRYVPYGWKAVTV